MGRIRTIKPEVLQTPAIASLPDVAHRTFFGLYSLVDDEGRTPADPLYIAGALFWARPRELAEVAAALELLADRLLVRPYSVVGVRYLEIVGWRDKDAITYQQINKPQPAKHPPPTEISPSGNVAGSESGSRSGTQDGTDGMGMDGMGSDPKGSESHTGASASFAPSQAQLDRLTSKGADPSYPLRRFLPLKAPALAPAELGRAFDAWIENAKPARNTGGAKGRAEPAPASAHPRRGKVDL